MLLLTSERLSAFHLNVLLALYNRSLRTHGIDGFLEVELVLFGLYGNGHHDCNHFVRELLTLGLNEFSDLSSIKVSRFLEVFVCLFAVLNRGHLVSCQDDSLLTLRLDAIVRLIRVTDDLFKLRKQRNHVSALDTVADVNGAVVTALRDGHGTRPPHRLNNVHSVADVASLTHLVKLSVAANFGDPGRHGADAFWNFLSRVKLASDRIGNHVRGDCGQRLSRLVFLVCGGEERFLLSIVSFDGGRDVVAAAASLKNTCWQVRPVSEVLQRLGVSRRLLLGQLELLSFLVDLKHAFREDLSSVLDSGQLRSEEVLLLAWERRAGFDWRRELSGQHLLDALSRANQLRRHVGQLNPVADKIIGYPEHGGVATCAVLLLSLGLQRLILSGQSALGNPVIAAGAEDFTEEFERFGATDLGQSTERFLNQHRVIFAETDACLLEDGGMRREVW